MTGDRKNVKPPDSSCLGLSCDQHLLIKPSGFKPTCGTCSRGATARVALGTDRASLGSPGSWCSLPVTSEAACPVLLRGACSLPEKPRDPLGNSGRKDRHTGSALKQLPGTARGQLGLPHHFTNFVSKCFLLGLAAHRPRSSPLPCERGSRCSGGTSAFAGLLH